MTSSSSGFTNMPPGAKVGVAAGGGGLFMYIVHVLFGSRGLLLVLAGLLLVALLLVLYVFFLKAHKKRKSDRLGKNIRHGFAGAPSGIAQADLIARIDDLRTKFEKGLETFRAAGKDLYGLPWNLMVGEPGCGKTEAIRHSNVGFPPGLHDELQGIGGTINMNWWFTNYAVILDTAGRLMFEDVETTATSEWKEFLNLLRRYRADCPINGMLLVISAESLIKDTAEDIEKKGASIARQFDTIQRVLDIRFPVFVLITKCDLINGFREFFDDLRDPQLQHQMLGWSNPAPIDQPFQPDLVSQHLEIVHRQLLDRRQVLLSKLDRPAGASGRLFDELDTLYDFPHSFSRVVPRLKRYLQIVFAAGEWATKPLFLRGIYFTSAMREGSALDADLAEALGVPVESLPEGRAWERDRAFFLRDVWMEKVFREKGLVTRAGSAQRLKRNRRLAVLGTGFASVALLFLMTWLGGRSLRGSVGLERDYWFAAAQGGWTEQQGAYYWMPLVYRDVDGKHAYGGLTPINVAGRRVPAGQFHSELLQRVVQPIRIPWIFSVNDRLLRLAHSEKGLNERRVQACRILFEAGVMRPVLDVARSRMTQESPEADPPDIQCVLEQLIRIEIGDDAMPAVPQATESDEDVTLLNLDCVFRYALAEQPDHYALFKENDQKSLEGELNWLYAVRGGRQSLDGLVLNLDLHRHPAIRNGVECYVRRCGRLSQTLALEEQISNFRQMQKLLAETDANAARSYAELEKRFLKKFTATIEGRDSLRTFDQWQKDWRKEFTTLDRDLEAFRAGFARIKTLYEAIPVLGRGPTNESYEVVLARAYAEAEACLKGLKLPVTVVNAGVPGPADTPKLSKSFATEVSARIGQAIEELQKKQEEQTAIAGEMKAAGERYAAIEAALRLCGNRRDIYAVADALSAAEVAVANEAELASAIDTWKEKTKKAELDINQRLDPNDPMCDSAAALSRSLCQVALRRRIFLGLDGLLAAAPARADDVARSVADRAAVMNPVRKPAIPLTEGEEGFFDLRYHPEAAAQVHAKWATLGEMLSDPGLQEAERELLKTAYRGRQLAYTDYARQFFAYYDTALADGIRLRVKSWSLSRRALTDAQASTANRDLKELCNNIDGAFAKCGELMKLADPDALARVREKLRRGIESFSQYAFTLKCTAVWDNWRALPADAVAARGSLLTMKPADFLKQYRVEGLEEGVGADAEYWASFTTELLQALISDAKSEILASLQDLNRYLRFPLARPAEGGRNLLPEEVVQASALLGRLQPSRPVRDGGAIGDGAVSGLKAMDQLLQDLRTIGLPAAMEKWMAAVPRVLGALPSKTGQALGCKVSILGQGAQKSLVEAAGGDVARDSVMPLWRVLALEQGGQAVGKAKTVQAENASVGSLRYPGENVVFKLWKYPSDEKHDATTTLDGPWACVHMLHAEGAVRDETNPRKWNVPVRVSSGQATGRVLWLQLEFDYDFPEIASWPTYEK